MRAEEGLWLYKVSLRRSLLNFSRPQALWWFNWRFRIRFMLCILLVRIYFGRLDATAFPVNSFDRYVHLNTSA